MIILSYVMIEPSESSGAVSRVVRFEDLEDYENVVHRESILDGVNAGDAVQFRMFSPGDQMERQLDFTVAAILKKYARESLQATIYTCLKELVINATKAAARLAYFHDHGLDPNDPEDVFKATESMRGRLDEAWIKKYGALAKDLGHVTSVRIHHEPAGLRIEVKNPAMRSSEEERVRRRLARGMQYDDLVTFYMEHGDQTEGEGLGLMMVLLLLKAEGVNPHYFRMGVVDDRTMARIEIPFTGDFQSVRGPDPAGHKR